MTGRYTRRAVIGTVGVAASGLAGCSGPASEDSPNDASSPADEETAAEATDGSGGDGDGPNSEDETDGGDGSDETAARSPSSGSLATLDLRVANVVGVSFEALGDGRYNFDVGLIHDDDGEDGYANWWQVEALDGTQLGRRKLSHAHGTQEFKRSAEVDVPNEHSCVVVRGHDQTHGYGGQAMLVNLDAGSVVPKRQGSDPQSFTEADCPD